MLTAKFNENICVVENSNGVKIGEIIYDNATDRTQCAIKIGDEVYDVNRPSKFKSTITVSENDTKVLDLKISSWSGNITIEPGNKKIKGISSWKGGTKLVDENGDTLITMNTKGVFLPKNLYEIEVVEKDTEAIFVVLSLYCHILSSKSKTMSVAGA